MEHLLEMIRAASTEDASAEARAAGAQACRAVLAVLDPQPPPSPPLELQAPIAQLATALRTVPLDQLLDLAIAKLRTALPPGVEVPAAPGLKIPLLPIGGRR